MPPWPHLFHDASRNSNGQCLPSHRLDGKSCYQYQENLLTVSRRLFLDPLAPRQRDMYS
ncbi:unnamed protein product [Nesidiocoris tenuis]|uniref:Uncharacterized protein n=1 Tax=Nesidiocoris tenuis TaxID=355587 RepID=A0A6H5G8J2_9HEMI|nr:unnamed protein product [Nesidiocoris tenuis]